jgi:hypothetical protein
MGENGMDLIRAARAEAFLKAARIYVQLEEFPNRDILIGLLSQGTIMPEKEERKLSENSGGEA